MKKIVGIMIGFLAMGALASASVVNCTSPAITNVVTQLDGTNSCYVTGASSILFSNFDVSPTTAVIGINTDPGTTEVLNGVVYLGFQISGLSAATTDILLHYEVSGSINGIDVALQAVALGEGGNVRISEIACKVAFVQGVCPGADSNTLAGIAAISLNGSAGHAQALFNDRNYVGPVYIEKDIQFNNATMSDFVNSHHVVPEPMTLSMMGIGLLGLGLMRRRQQGKK
jgi:hypothetical protein